MLDLDQRVVCGIRMYSRFGRPAVLRRERCMAFVDQVADSLGQRLVPHVRVFEHKSSEPPASAEAVAKAAAAGAGEGAAPRAGPRVEQTNTFAPVFHVRVESNEADAAEKFLARVSPMLTQMMAEQQRKTTNFSAMFDAPHL
ncbi:hypothetical protein ACS0X5_08685 [Burkholderia gladioli]|uniref:hypothetical protein n=1 Tax=Burkholderia gladioli TaxID=28095 RepID=UPI003F79DAD1